MAYCQVPRWYRGGEGRGFSLTDLRMRRRRLNRELSDWAARPVATIKGDNIERSANRGALLLAELVALYYEIRERERAADAESEIQATPAGRDGIPSDGSGV